MSAVEVQILNRLGLHARAAAKMVHVANRYKSAITVSRTDSRVDGKSILGLLTLAASQGTRLTLSADGADANEALAALSTLVRERFGEDE
ncbi:MAG TPA: HPr family phosphocarrier protein [Candidatus Polarisedimenticolaceae bacterium]|nr:HPr family phosphocarrier protein [Candidatus Polarisedimenticolaceae bacterium]